MKHPGSMLWVVSLMLTAPLLLGNRGCKPEVGGRHDDDGPCTARECGPMPGAPNYQCEDGSLAGPGPCERLADGRCGYTFRTCPDGESDSAQETCGGIAGLVCPSDGYFCNYEPAAGGQGCDGTIADAAGVCQVQPTDCTLQYDPVCGCDRATYGNACAAHTAGVSVLHAGMCSEVDCEALGGRAVPGIGPPPECAEGEIEHGYIQYESGAMAVEGLLCCLPG